MALAVAGLTAMTYGRSHEQHPRLTTEAALLLTLLTAGPELRRPAMASGNVGVLDIQLLWRKVFELTLVPAAQHAGRSRIGCAAGGPRFSGPS